ncbi:coatomer epsilon subunit protein [Cardiosporidium cionae]|uniref:Coatomer epsilon subunit protein n=1 Tax=Cardiosporidium cionae TaxID=476202 RepID=A0ABQ7JB84_9APIC|nr:coatomer epsilon subunit protein [Cardiosporidium cionae]|eukprot:KAF8821271.1 coatomer epsilon subunit protein [Cardiosporidium cionae]
MDELRNRYYLGYFEQCCNSAMQHQSLADGDVSTLSIRAKACLYPLLLSEYEGLIDSRDVGKSIVGIFSHLKKTTYPPDRKVFLDNLLKMSSMGDLDSKCMIASIFEAEADYSTAFKLCAAESIELLTLEIFIMIKLGYIAAAEALVNKLDDEEILGKLTTAWIRLATGSYKEAYLTFGDIQGICNDEDTKEYSSVTILNGKAIANMQRRMWPEALEDLEKAYVQNPTDENTLANLVCCHRNLLNEPKALSYYNILLESHDDHMLVLKTKQLEDTFDNFRI